MAKKAHTTRLPYRSPDTVVPDFLLEQNLSIGSSDDSLSDMVTTDIYDAPFNPIV